VATSERKRVWQDVDCKAAISYVERGSIWLVTGEPLAGEEDLLAVSRDFVEYARSRRKVAVFLPSTERFARAITSLDVRIHKIGASPYFDLQNWNPRGNCAKHMRVGINRARRARIVVEQVSEITTGFRAEVQTLTKGWLERRAAGIQFGWLFEVAPFENVAAKKYYSARDEDGKLVGVLAASPIPARDGWYLEDVLRSADAPSGTSDLLVFEALTMLKLEGAKLATLGTVPLSTIGTDEISTKGVALNRVLGFTRRNLNTLYNFEGLRCFKSKFVPSWWESEYVVVSRAHFLAPRVGLAIIRSILDGSNFGLTWAVSSITRVILNGDSRRTSHTSQKQTTVNVGRVRHKA
jgi:phosphatidylglycerol lysyltransferase